MDRCQSIPVAAIVRRAIEDAAIGRREVSGFLGTLGHGTPIEGQRLTFLIKGAHPMKNLHHAQE